MSALFKQGSYSWCQVGLLKLALLSIGVAIGSYWPGVFVEYAMSLLVIGGALGFYLGYVWIKQ